MEFIVIHGYFSGYDGLLSYYAYYVLLNISMDTTFCWEQLQWI